MPKDIAAKLQKLPLGAVTPDGWLKSQISLTNELQKRLGSDSGLLENGVWEKGETLPKYVRGLLLLAGVLHDAQLTEKAEAYVGAIFDSANAGGDFGPFATNYESPKIEAVKAVLTYYELTSDERALKFLRRFFKNQFNTFSVTPCWYHSRARLLEEIPAIDAVYRANDLEWLKDLAEMLRDRTCDWFRIASKFPYKKSSDKTLSQAAVKRVRRVVCQHEDAGAQKHKPFTVERADAEWKKPSHQRVVQLSGVSMAKAVKYPCVYGAFMGDKELKRLSLKMITALDRYHGNATGMFAADNRLAGTSPVRGIDIESAVEMMESLVAVLAETGESACADMLEQIAFNVIAAAATEDVSAVQDVVLPNQIEASLRRKEFFKDCPAGNAFVADGLSRGAVALLSALPLFLQSVCFKRGADELDFFSYAPCVVETVVGGVRLRIREETGYPFRNTVVFKVEEADGEANVRINFRVPRHTTMQLISGGQVVASGDRNISVKCALRTGSTFMLKLNIPLVALPNRDGSFSLMKGSVLMASAPGYEKSVKKAENTLCEARAVTKWSYTPVLAKKAVAGVRRLYENERTVVNKISEKPFNCDIPPFELRIRCKNVINWEYDINGFAALPNAPKFSEETLERRFLPFGCTTVRISQFPPCFRG